MINKVSVLESTKFHPKLDDKKTNTTPSFEGKNGAAVVGAVVAGMQYLERNPMMNVSFLDVCSAIGPRSIFDTFTNIFAGLETLCRESFGLIINCLLPGFVALGAGKLLDKFVIKTGGKMANCNADTETIDKISKVYKQHNGEMPKVYETLLTDIQGVDGNDIYKYSSLKKNKLEEFGIQLANAKDETSFKKVINTILTETKVNENIRFGDKGAYLKDTSVSSLLENTRKFVEGYECSGKNGIEAFSKKASRLVKGKTAMAFAFILPLAASIQFFNRWMTGRLSGIKGAPIYEDFKEAKNDPELYSKIKEKGREGLLKEKILSISEMCAVAAASILLTSTQRPSFKMLGRMLQFKGKFPTMDQARFISAITFSSRIAAADDKNEVRESRGKDIATFLSLYFLGDYGGKAAASAIEATNKDVKLLNRTVVSPQNANSLIKFKNWMLNTHIKSSKELMHSPKAQKYRSLCQAANLASSFAILGLIIYERKKTKKKHEQAKSLIRTQIEQEQQIKTLEQKQKEQIQAA